MQVQLSLTGVDRIVTATLLTEASHLNADETITHFEHAPASRLLADRAENEPLADALWLQRSTLQRALPLLACKRIHAVANTTTGFAPKATVTAAPCAV